VEVTGEGFGEATLTITSASGSVKKIPIQVYNHLVLDAGELKITYVDDFELVHHESGVGRCYPIWHWWGSWWFTWDHKASFYHPIIPEGYHALGSFAIPEIADADGKYAMMVVKQAEGSDALAEPIGYELQDYSLACRDEDPMAIWYPVPPEGYKTMGMVVTKHIDDDPTLSNVVCVREDLTIPGSAGRFLWNTDVSPHTPDNWRGVGCWSIDPPKCGPHENTYLHTGTFVAHPFHYEAPETHPVMNVLKFELPMLAEAPEQSYIPRLESYDSPPAETVPLMSKTMLVPCTIINDEDYVDRIGWRVANSPFYRLERQVYYKLLYHNYNQTSLIQDNSVTIRSGVTTERSETFSNETAISVTVELGCNIEWFTGKISTSFSKKFGYSSTTSISELQQSYYESSISTAPGKAAALWQKWNRFVLKRHNGTDLEVVTFWDFGIDSYVTDEYPD